MFFGQTHFPPLPLSCPFPLLEIRMSLAKRGAITTLLMRQGEVLVRTRSSRQRWGGSSGLVWQGQMHPSSAWVSAHSNYFYRVRHLFSRILSYLGSCPSQGSKQSSLLLNQQNSSFEFKGLCPLPPSSGSLHSARSSRRSWVVLTVLSPFSNYLKPSGMLLAISSLKVPWDRTVAKLYAPLPCSFFQRSWTLTLRALFSLDKRAFST